MSKVKEFRTKDKRVKEEMDKNFLQRIQEFKKNGDLEYTDNSKNFCDKKAYI